MEEATLKLSSRSYDLNISMLSLLFKMMLQGRGSIVAMFLVAPFFHIN